MERNWTPAFDVLRLYLTHFPGQRVTSLSASALVGGRAGDVVDAMRRELGGAAVGDRVECRGHVGEVALASDVGVVVRVTEPVPGSSASSPTTEGTRARWQPWRGTSSPRARRLRRARATGVGRLAGRARGPSCADGRPGLSGRRLERAGRGAGRGRRSGTGGCSAAPPPPARWPPWRFDWYMAASARAMRASAPSPATDRAMPMLALALSVRSPSEKGAASAVRRRSPMATLSASRTSGHTMRNSSPPMRPTRSTSARPIGGGRRRRPGGRPRTVPVEVVHGLEPVEVHEHRCRRVG
jgi:hypothetical protein